LRKYGRIDVAQTLLSVLVPVRIEKTSATILSLDDGMREIAYEETEHYRRAYLRLRRAAPCPLVANVCTDVSP
jgi:hypothetical protein